MTDAPDELTVFDDYSNSATPVTFEADDRPLGITDVELAVFEGEAVLFDVQASMVHLFNAVAGATWMCCDGETTVAAMIDELADTFGVTDPADVETLTGGVHQSLARFAAEGLLADHPSPGHRLTMTPTPVLADDGTVIVVPPPDP